MKMVKGVAPTYLRYGYGCGLDIHCDTVVAIVSGRDLPEQTACSHTQNTYPSFKNWKHAQRRGKKKVAMSIRHEILKAANYMLRDNIRYKERNSDRRFSMNEEKRKWGASKKGSKNVNH